MFLKTCVKYSYFSQIDLQKSYFLYTVLANICIYGGRSLVG